MANDNPALPDGAAARSMVESGKGDAALESGGSIAGLARPAFTLRRPRSLAIPVLIAVPHAGRAYPPELLLRMRHGDVAMPRLEDRFVDLVAREAAAICGTALLVAHAPRAMIDLNRHPGDLDLSMFTATEAEKAAMRRDMPRGGQSVRSNRGLGLFPRRLPGIGELWRVPLRPEEASGRIAAIHAPYHESLAACLAEIRRQWGRALLVDLHSMPALPRRPGGLPAPTHVVGDRFGGSCGRDLVECAVAVLDAAGAECGYNRPYAGGYVLDRHGAPRRGIHAMQLEIARDLYLDDTGLQPSDGVASEARLVAAMIRGVVETMTGDTQFFRQAAE